MAVVNKAHELLVLTFPIPSESKEQLRISCSLLYRWGQMDGEQFHDQFLFTFLIRCRDCKCIWSRLFPFTALDLWVFEWAWIYCIVSLTAISRIFNVRVRCNIWLHYWKSIYMPASADVELKVKRVQNAVFTAVIGSECSGHWTKTKPKNIWWHLFTLI